MTKSEFISLLKNPSNINEESVNSLNELKKVFPYCQNSYILLAKSTHDNGSMHANEMLKKAAAYSTHRDVLKKIINFKKEIVEKKVIETSPKKDIETQNKPSVSIVKEKTGSSDIIKELQKELIKSKSLKEEKKEPEKEVLKKEIQSTTTSLGIKKKSSLISNKR